MLKRTVVRLLLFGIPFGLSYWATMPAAHVTGNQTLVVCAYPGDRPGELRISLDPAGCLETDGGSKIVGAAPVSIHPAVNIPQTIENHTATKPLTIPF
jgi:hypothetical protein